MKIKVKCKALESGAKDGEWYQTFPPYGEYPADGLVKKNGKPVKGARLVFDEATAKAIMEAFAADRAAEAGWPGVLVDREHWSCDADGDTRAMAWATEMRQEEDGSIWTRWAFTPEGRELVESKTYVSRSPVFEVEDAGGGAFRASRLVSIGLTNTPFFRVLSTVAAAKAAEVNNEKQGETEMDKILEALGLAADAGEDAALAAIQALKDKASAAEAAATEAEDEKEKAQAECRAMKADAFVAKHAGRFADEAAAKAAYIENPELAEKMVASFAVPAEQKVLDPAKAKSPVLKNKAREGLAACKSPAERVSYVMKHAEELAQN